MVFTRLPEVGGNKTRLIPALGAEGASAFHERLARHAVGRASAYALSSSGCDLEIRLTGGSCLRGREWLGGGDVRDQGEGDLGERMARAIKEALDEGFGKVVVIGTDCPGLDQGVLAEAFEALDECDGVIGPARDGGYYLIGMKRFAGELFADVEWGGPRVLSRTLETIARLGWKHRLLEELADVDVPEDLPGADSELAKGESVSVIIPALNEEAVLRRTLERVMESSQAEVIVSIGESNDDTRRIADEMGAEVVDGRNGRAAQMNRAASLASGEFLLFLHADTLAPSGYPKAVTEVLSRPGVAAGAFRLGLDDQLGASALIERLVDLRCRLSGIPYGDQGLFVRRDLFEGIGGYPQVESMEDLKLVESLKRLGRVVISPQRVESSTRRWREKGLIRTFLRHQAMIASRALRT